MPVVSVSIPCYNATSTPQKERWLRRSIESVLNQTFEDFELLLIDDGSTDDTAEVLREYTDDPRVEYIYQENQGYAGARNTGLEEGYGEYFTFIGQDDVWLPTKLERQLEHVHASDADVIHTNVSHIDGDGKRIGIRHESPPPEQTDQKEFIETLFLGNFVCIQSALVHRSVFESLRFDEQFRINCDHDVWLRAAEKHQFEYLDEILVEKRYHGKNTSGDYERMFKERQMIADKMVEHHPFLQHLQSKKLSDANLFYGIDQLKAGETTRAKKSLRSAITQDAMNWQVYPTYLLALTGSRLGSTLISYFSRS